VDDVEDPLENVLLEEVPDNSDDDDEIAGSLGTESANNWQAHPVHGVPTMAIMRNGITKTASIYPSNFTGRQGTTKIPASCRSPAQLSLLFTDAILEQFVTETNSYGKTTLRRICSMRTTQLRYKK
jgi:hypothetical protein